MSNSNQEGYCLYHKNKKCMDHNKCDGFNLNCWIFTPVFEIEDLYDITFSKDNFDKTFFIMQGHNFKKVSESDYLKYQLKFHQLINEIFEKKENDQKT